MKNERLVPIQWLRGFAAMLVVWFHASAQFEWLDAFVYGAVGEVGVDIFFVISGFIMTAISTNTPEKAPGAFLRDRLIRVVPLYWVITLGMVVLATIPPYIFGGLSPTLASTLKSLFFIPHYSDTRPEQIWPLLVPGWTLNYEMFFYLLFAVALFFRAKSHIAVIGGCLLLVGFGLLLGPFQSAAAKTYTDPLLLEFVIGVLIGTAYRRNLWIRSASLATAIAICGAALIVAGQVVEPRFMRALEVIGAATLVVACVRPTVRSRWTALGESSYSIYLTHVLVLACLKRLWGTPASAEMAWSAWLFMLFAMVVCVFVGRLTFLFLEKPLTKAARAAVLYRSRAPALPAS